MTRPTVKQGAAAVWGAAIDDTLVGDPAEQADGPLGRLDFVIDARVGGARTLAVRQGEYAWLALANRKFGVVDADVPPRGPPKSVGNMTLEWRNCEKGRLANSMPSPELTGTLELQRIVPDNVALCEPLQP